jgi:hypothetical protein
MRLLIRIVAVLAAVSVLGTVWFVAAFAAAGGLRALLTSGLLGGLTIVGWLIALVVGPVATVQLWRFRQSGRRAGIVLFGYGLAYYVVGLLALRSPEASTRQVLVAATMFALPLVVLLRSRVSASVSRMTQDCPSEMSRHWRRGASESSIRSSTRSE